MKKKILAWCAAVLMVALVSTAFLRPADPNPDFGNVERLYTLEGSVKITDCEGDTDIIRATSYSLSSARNFCNVTVWFEVDRTLARTSVHYRDGVRVGHGEAERAGMIERLIDGEWVEVDSFSSGLYGAQLSMGSPGYGLISEDYPSVGFNLVGMFPEPGLYRITHYFREDISRELHDYETGTELYTVTHTVEVPEPSGKPFDIYGVMLWNYAPHSDNYRQVAIHFNFGEKDVYMDRARMTLEKRVGLRWVEVEDVSEDEPSVWSRAAEDDPADRRYHAYHMACIFPYIDDSAAVYRLTLEFVENEDGSGERYTLTLDLKFS